MSLASPVKQPGHVSSGELHPVCSSATCCHCHCHCHCYCHCNVPLPLFHPFSVPLAPTPTPSQALQTYGSCPKSVRAVVIMCITIRIRRAHTKKTAPHSISGGPSLPCVYVPYLAHPSPIPFSPSLGATATGLEGRPSRNSAWRKCVREEVRHCRHSHPGGQLAQLLPFVFRVQEPV